MSDNFVWNPGNGGLFKNDRKETEKHPDYKGQITLPDGQEAWLSAWLKDGSRGKWLSVSVQLKDDQSPPKGSEPDEDEIPF